MQIISLVYARSLQRFLFEPTLTSLYISHCWYHCRLSLLTNLDLTLLCRFFLTLIPPFEKVTVAAANLLTSPVPRNAFIIFRSSYIHDCTSTGEGQQNELSKHAGKVWNGMTAKEKAPFAERAAAEKLQHQAITLTVLQLNGRVNWLPRIPVYRRGRRLPRLQIPPPPPRLKNPPC
jgi:HMG (high mobility group) box